MNFKSYSFVSGTSYIIFVLLLVLLIACENIVQEPNTNFNVEDFEATWNRVNEVYPYLEFKGINWDSLYNAYLPRAQNARGDEIYFVLHDLLEELADGHVYYHTNGGGEVYPYVMPRLIKDRHAYSPFVVRKYFDRPLKVTDSGSAEYEILPDNIGYIFLSDFHENYLLVEFPGVLEYMRDTQGLIIDIRQKRGGDYGNVEAVVTRFMTGPLNRPALYLLGELIEDPPFQPGEPFIYTNPVVVLINGATYSAGEMTTEILKQLPQVTAVGDTTGGGSAGGWSTGNGVMDYELPSGKLISVGTVDIRRYDNLPWEWLGVAPDIRIEQTAEDIENGIDPQLEYAIELLR